jgi:ketosteroid isomerase-like protein
MVQDSSPSRRIRTIALAGMAITVSPMTDKTLNRRTFLSAAAAATAMHTNPLFALSSGVQQGAEAFLKDWVAAWNGRDAHALASLHTDDAMTINRYGTLIRGRSSSEEALSFLLGPQGSFGDTVFPPMKIVVLREIVPGVAIVQSSWGAPVLGANGKTVPVQFNEMILTYTLVKHGADWKTTQIDGHNVEKMHLPYSSPDQKK